VAWGRSLVY